MSTSVPVRWSRALATLLSGLLAVGFVVAAGYAATALLSQAVDRSGAVCGSAWRFHTGSGTQVSGAELKPAQREEVSAECARSGDPDWQRGVRFGRLAAGAGLAAIAFALWARFGPSGPSAPRRSRPRRSHPGPAPDPDDPDDPGAAPGLGASGPDGRRAPTAGPPPW